MKLKANWDSLGIFTSLACAVHCAILPLVATSLPLFGVNIIHNSLFEWFMIAIAFGVGVYALYHGYITHHKNNIPVILFLVGMIFLIVKQFFHRYEIYFLIPAVILIVSAHYYNYRLCSRYKCASAHHVH